MKTEVIKLEFTVSVTAEMPNDLNEAIEFLSKMEGLKLHERCNLAQFAPLIYPFIQVYGKQMSEENINRIRNLVDSFAFVRPVLFDLNVTKSEIL